MPDIDRDLMKQRGIKFAFDALNDYPLYQDKGGKGMSEIFDLLRSGIFELELSSIYPLTQAAAAHADMESRKTTGSVILKPEIFSDRIDFHKPVFDFTIKMACRGYEICFNKTHRPYERKKGQFNCP